MEAYGSARTKNRKGVTIPSQRRFVEYFGHCCERRHVVDLDSVYTTHRFRDEDLGGRGWGMTCAPLLDQAWNARWRKQATDCPAPPRRAVQAPIFISASPRWPLAAASDLCAVLGDRHSRVAAFGLYTCLAPQLTRCNYQACTQRHFRRPIARIAILRCEQRDRGVLRALRHRYAA